MTNGWIKISRRITKHWLWKDPVKLYWWLDLLISANWEDTKEVVGSKLIIVKRGQLRTSKVRLAMRWQVHIDTARRFLQMLQDDGMIEYYTTPKYNILTICNYDSYQDCTNSNTDTNNNTKIEKITNSKNDSSNNCDTIDNTITTNSNTDSKNNSNTDTLNKEINNIINTQQTRANYKKDEQPAAAPTYVPSLHTTLEKVYQEYRTELGTETETSNAALRTAKNFCGRMLTRNELVALLDIFNDQQLAQGETHATCSDYRRHFLSWLPYQLKAYKNGISVQQPNRRDISRSTEQPGADF